MAKRINKYNKENIQQLVNESTSVRQILFKLGLKLAGGNYSLIKRKINEFEIDTSHFTGLGQLKGKSHSYSKVDPKEYLICNKDSHRTSYHICKWLIRDGIKKHQCERCGLTEWLDDKIPLELHHKNGIKYDYQIENIELLCPNCHSLTDNHRGKKLRKKV